MGQRLRKFVPRAPRYVLRAQDRRNMRFSFEDTYGDGAAESTLLLNLSETGIAFLVNTGSEPRLGRRIKVEIPIPGGDQIAWWARVVRNETYEPRGWSWGTQKVQEGQKVLVGLRFENMPGGHTIAIRRGLARSFMQAMRDQQYRTWLYYKHALIQNIWKAILYTALTIATVGLIYWLSRPDANYDAKRGTPWGERFKFF